MTDRIFLHLNERWALASDGLQWIVMKYRPPKWRPVSFIAGAKGSKAVLLRVLREKGVSPTDEALAALDRLPDSFRQWQKERINGAES